MSFNNPSFSVQPPARDAAAFIRNILRIRTPVRRLVKPLQVCLVMKPAMGDEPGILFGLSLFTHQSTEILQIREKFGHSCREAPLLRQARDDLSGKGHAKASRLVPSSV